MPNAMKITLATLAALFVFGCKKNSGENTTVSSYVENEGQVSASRDDLTSATIARITSATVSLTNCLCQGSDKAMERYRQILAEIGTLPPEVGGQCAKTAIKRILAVPYERLEVSERLGAVDVMCNIIWGVERLDIGEVDLWECYVLLLARARDVIQYTQSREGSRAGGFFMQVSRRLQNVTEYLERKLAFWRSLPSPSAIRFRRNKIVTEEEYAIVRGKFERFLGRPIRLRGKIKQVKAAKVRPVTPEDVQREAERRQLEVRILEDKRTGRKDSWYVGGATNLQETSSNAPIGK